MCDAKMLRSRTKAQSGREAGGFSLAAHGAALISIARSQLRTFAAINAPCSVNTNGRYRRPPRPMFEVTDCDLKRVYSSAVSWNTKSSGNRAAFRRTAWLSARVSTRYSPGARRRVLHSSSGISRDLADQGAGQVPQSRATGDVWQVGQAHLDASFQRSGRPQARLTGPRYR